MNSASGAVSPNGLRAKRGVCLSRIDRELAQSRPRRRPRGRSAGARLFVGTAHQVSERSVGSLLGLLEDVLLCAPLAGFGETLGLSGCSVTVMDFDLPGRPYRSSSYCHAKATSISAMPSAATFQTSDRTRGTP